MVEEAQLRWRRRRRDSTAAQGEEPSRARHVDADPAKIRREAQRRASARRHQAALKRLSMVAMTALVGFVLAQEGAAVLADLREIAAAAVQFVLAAFGRG